MGLLGYNSGFSWLSKPYIPLSDSLHGHDADCIGSFSSFWFGDIRNLYLRPRSGSRAQFRVLCRSHTDIEIGFGGSSGGRAYKPQLSTIRSD
jgi:hypothetical protein